MELLKKQDYNKIEVIKMSIYIIFATKINGEMERISPMGVNRDKDEMIKIAKRMKYEMKDFYKKIELRRDIYQYQGSDFIEV